MENRKTIGERMLERLDNRDRSHPAIDKKVSRFEDRFARYGRTAIDSRLGYFLSPSAQMASQNNAWGGVDDANWVSAAPYWARLQRLGNARLRREQRLAAFAARSERRSSLSAIKRLPDVRPRSLPFLGLTGLLTDQFEVLAPLPSVDDTEQVSQFNTVPQDPSRPWSGAGRAGSPWLSREYTPAKVANSKKRPIERIQERAPATRAVIERTKRSVELSSKMAQPATKEVATAPVSQRKGSSASKSVLESTPGLEQPVRRVRRSMKGQSNPIRYVEQDFEAALPDDFLPPSRHAQGRLPAQRRSRRRGLRTAMSRSPLMAALEPVGQGGGIDGPSMERQPTAKRSRIGGQVGRSAHRRTAHREISSSTPLLSASPVRRPAMMAPSAVTLAAIDGNEPYVSDEVTPPSSPRRSAVAPTVKAVSRAVSLPEPLFEKPLSARRPVASRPVLTRSGKYAPETEVLIPGTTPSEVTEDAVPKVAEVRARRSTMTANAVERAHTGIADRITADALHKVSTASVDRVLGESGVVSDRVDRTEQAATTASRRANAPVRTASGAYVPATELLVPDGPLASSTDVAPPPRSSARDSVLARVDERQHSKQPMERPSQQAIKASERLGADPLSVAATELRRMRPATTAADAAVLAPLPSHDELDLPQGQHAAERADRPPTIGQSSTKTVRGFKKLAEQVPTSPTERRLAPRRFTSPVSHIQMRRAAKGTRISQFAGTRDGRIVLSSADTPLAESSSRRDAQVAAHERIEQAWQTAGRPLDWTDARIDIIQVPMMVAAASEEREAPRTERTPSGDYVPARTGRGRVSRDVMTGTDSVTLARPDGVEINARRDGGEISGGFESVGQTATVGSTAIDPTRNDPMTVGRKESRTGSWRSGFDATVGRVESGAVHRDLPIWAQRSTGRPRIKSGDDLVQQLAQARAPEDVVQVLMDQGNAARTATSSLPQPVIQVIQQIRTEATRAEEEVVRTRRIDAATLPTETVRSRANRREGVRSTTRVARGMTGLNPRGSSSGQSSQAMNKVTQLAKRLQELIAMAESQNRSGARQQVRMAEDSGAAKAEGQAAPTSAEGGRDASADIDTLAREVTEQVTRELEMRRERRQEDPDGRSIWW